jgi:hypothetical protein
MRAPLAGLLVLLVAGCGGGGGGDDRLTSEELASRADAICAQYAQRVNALKGPGSFAELAAYAQAAHRALAEGLTGLQKLRPPTDEETQYASWVETGKRALRRIDELEQAAEQKDQLTIARLVASTKREDAESDELAKKLGMVECAND